jgi:hypothetical protein
MYLQLDGEDVKRVGRSDENLNGSGDSTCPEDLLFP